jgi:hypothetical protein
MTTADKLGFADSIITSMQEILDNGKIDKVTRSGKILLRKDLENLYLSIAQWRAVNKSEDA